MNQELSNAAMPLQIERPEMLDAVTGGLEHVAAAAAEILAKIIGAPPASAKPT